MSAKLNSEVRLDLINEINDEFLEEDGMALGGSKPASASNPQNMSLDDEDDEDQKIYMGDSVSGLVGGGVVASEDEDGDEDNNDSSSINLANLRVSIDGLDEVNESSRTGYVFVIRVWNLDPKLVVKSGVGDTPNWFVKRKYDEFYVLDARLRQFHGGGLMTGQQAKNQISVVQLPSKPRAILSFSNKENNLEYLESIQNDFERYIQSLLTNPILAKSKLIKSFLDPSQIEFNSSLLNNITNLGKMVKGVPYKLRVERGQSLDSFLSFLFKTIRPIKPKPSQTSVNYEDITDKQLSQSEFANPEKSRTILKKSNQQNNGGNSESSDEYVVAPFESFMFLSKIFYVFCC